MEALIHKRTFSKPDRELYFGIHVSNIHNNYTSVNTQYNQPANTAFYGTNNDNPGKETETEVVLDYTEPITEKINLGVGGKMVFYRYPQHISNVLSLQPASGMYVYDSTLSNFLRYQQQVYALYAELNFPVSGWFNAKMGLRYERTDLNPFFSDISTEVSEPGYNTFVPSIFLSRKLNDKQTLKLSYSKRIERPDYRELNPFINTTDPYNITTGNPYLQPEIGHRFELGWNYDLDAGGSFMVSAFYRLNQNDIQPYVVATTRVSPVGRHGVRVAVSTRQNIGTEKNLGMNLFADLHLTSKFNLRTNLFLFYRQGINALDSNLKVESSNYRINMNYLTYNFSTTLVRPHFVTPIQFAPVKSRVSILHFHLIPSLFVNRSGKVRRVRHYQATHWHYSANTRISLQFLKHGPEFLQSTATGKSLFGPSASTSPGNLVNWI